MLIRRFSLAVSAICVPMALIAMSNPESYAGSKARSADQTYVHTQMRNVMYHFSQSVAVHIKSLDGDLVPSDASGYPVFDKKDSFHVLISSAEITITAIDLANVLNSYVFARGNAPLKGLSIAVEKDHRKIKGRLHEVGVIPVETDGELSPKPDGKILLHAAKVKALHVPVKKIMNLFGVELSDLIKNGKVPGVESREDDLILDPAQVFPPPHMQGKVTAIHLEGQNIQLTFGENKAVKNLQSGNYMSYRGNRLAFGRLLMTDADMNLIDMDSNDPFDFYLDHYKDQLTAGYTKITPTFGLRVFMRNFNKLEKSTGKGRQKTADENKN
jgi:hypothetical protein